ncbi:hypothetical protein GIV50_26315, partial [Pseudomonas syringae]|nr:hypothetical protein [Pseudomonas syringae]
MVQEIIQCERSGVNPKWPSYKSVLGRIAKGPHVSDEYEIAGIREYVTREDASPKRSMMVPNRNNATDARAEWMSVTRAHKVLATATENPRWLSELAHWMRYYQVGIWQLFFWAGQFDVLAKAVGNDRRQQNYSIQTAANMMAAMAILGWKEAVIHQG